MWWRSQSPDETRAIGHELGARISRDGATVGLSGALGVGKTLFVKGVAEGLGLDVNQVSSPTFVIANEYSTPGLLRLVHVDFYRVNNSIEIEEVGWWDWLQSESAIFVEWGDKFPDLFPSDRLEISITIESKEERKIGVVAHGQKSKKLLKHWLEFAPKVGLCL